jgi:NAD-dependent DNA ligase
MRTDWNFGHLPEVLEGLRDMMENESDGEVKYTEINFTELSAGHSRHSAAVGFAQLLQLQTWNFVKLNQENNGDIIVSPGPRFDEDVLDHPQDNTLDHHLDNKFQLLVPGVDGALHKNMLVGKTFVIAGKFPEVGGGDGNAVGHANIKAMIESFGGKVNKKFSTKTSKFTTLTLNLHPMFISNN